MRAERQDVGRAIPTDVERKQQKIHGTGKDEAKEERWMKSFQDIFAECEARPGRTVAVAGAGDPVILQALAEGVELGVISGGILYVTEPSRLSSARDSRLSSALDSALDSTSASAWKRSFKVISTESDREACAEAVRAVAEGSCDMLMKGHVQTKDFMKAVLSKEAGLAGGRILSQTGIYEIPGLDRLLLVADVGIVISPGLEEKVQIVEGALEVASALKIERPRVALLSCVETINPSIPGSVDAAVITMMNKRGQIKGVPSLVDGPLALDNALSKEAAAHKGITSDVAGAADVLICPDLNSGNIFAKSIIYLTGARAAGVVTGARCPIVLTSRADSKQTKLNSMAVAALL